jgi:glycosyltransferase involved in cell wall biosynthesis
MGAPAQELHPAARVVLPHHPFQGVLLDPGADDPHGDRDGLPNVALEAMASGRALVVSDVSALGPTVRAAGSGIVVPPGDSEALAEALDRLQQPGERAVLAAAGRSYVERHFDLADCTRRLVEHLAALHAGTVPAQVSRKASGPVGRQVSIDA